MNIKISVAVAFFLPVGAKDLSVLLYNRIFGFWKECTVISIFFSTFEHDRKILTLYMYIIYTNFLSQII
jgi:hypothetical protein